MLRTTRLIHGIATAALIAGCGGGDAPAVAVDFTDVEVHEFSGVAVAREVAVMDDAAWAALWAEHTRRLDPAPPRPAVDFNSQSVAAVFLGDTAGCSRPVIRSVDRTGSSELRVAYQVVTPERSTPCPAVVFTPAHVVRFDNAAKLPLSFRRI
jgi:hypothetical protein